MTRDKRDNKTISKGDNVESIDSLTSVVQKMEASFRFWHDWSNWLIVITIIAGVCLYFFQYKANETAILLGKEKDKLSEHKDREQALQIVNVKNDAATKISEVKAGSEENIAQVKAEADKQIALLNVEAEKAKSEIAKAQAQAAQANEKAESERLARVQLEARLADRKLTKEQQERLVSLLEPFRDTEVDVVVLGDTSEIRLIGMTLLECLNKAGWKVYQGYGSGGGVVVKGILVGVRSDSNLSGAATILVEGLRSLGIDTGLWDFEKLQYPSILMNTNLTHKTPMKIFIGSKP